MTEYIDVSEDLYKLLSYIAEKLHCTPSEIVEEAVNEYYYDEKKKMKMNNLTENKKVRPCKDSWEYCDGNCMDCEKNNVTVSDHTD